MSKTWMSGTNPLSSKLMNDVLSSALRVTQDHPQEHLIRRCSRTTLQRIHNCVDAAADRPPPHRQREVQQLHHQTPPEQTRGEERRRDEGKLAPGLKAAKRRRQHPGG